MMMMMMMMMIIMLMMKMIMMLMVTLPPQHLLPRGHGVPCVRVLPLQPRGLHRKGQYGGQRPPMTSSGTAGCETRMMMMMMLLLLLMMMMMTTTIFTRRVDDGGADRASCACLCVRPQGQMTREYFYSFAFALADTLEFLHKRGNDQHTVPAGADDDDDDGGPCIP
jgi:hypothetical protein